MKKSQISFLAILIMGLAVFFGRFRQLGLSPDAALYAGLSAKVLRTSEYWRLSGSPEFFKNYFEHPPYFFQWGALVLKLFGNSDGAARAIGAIPGFTAFLCLVIWLQRRAGLSVATLTGLLILTFGHYTKYAASPMLEAPLSLGFVLTFIGLLEGLERKTFFKGIGLLFFLGLAISSAAKGIVGLGPWAAGSIFLLMKAKRQELPRQGLVVFLGLIATLFPLALWAAMTRPQTPLEVWHFKEYLAHQVYRSFTSDRGDLSHTSNGGVFTYFAVILKYGWPWWWTVPAALLRYRKKKISAQFFKTLTPAALLFFASVFVPFSLATFKLPHYLHPTYLILAPVGAYFFLSFEKFQSLYTRLLNKSWFWILLAIGLCFAMPAFFKGLSTSGNRGQAFIDAAQSVGKLPQECALLVNSELINAYRMESYSLWYFQGRRWSFRFTAEDSLPCMWPWEPRIPF